MSKVEYCGVVEVMVDEFLEMVAVTVETYAQLFSDGNITTFSSSDEAQFVLALSGVITSKYIISLALFSSQARFSQSMKDIDLSAYLRCY